MKLRIFLAGCWFLGALGIYAAEPPPPLLSNGDFTSVNAVGIPVGWSSEKSDDVVQVPHSKRTACFAVRIRNATSFENNQQALIRQDNLLLRPGKTYRLTWGARAEKGVRYRSYVEVCKPTWQGFGLQWFEGTGQWESYTTTGRFEKLEALPYVVLQVWGPGHADFSSVTIEEAK